jgi:hypothetical protein
VRELARRNQFDQVSAITDRLEQELELFDAILIAMYDERASHVTD